MARPAHAAASSSPSANPSSTDLVLHPKPAAATPWAFLRAHLSRLAALAIRVAKWKPVLLAGSAGALLAGLALFLVGSRFSAKDPSWWRRGLTPSSANALALETGLLDQVSRVERKGQAIPNASPGQVKWRSEPWRMSMQAQDANSWLTVQLPKWLASRQPPVAWPEEIAEIQTQFEEGVIHLGVRLKHGDRERIITATVEPYVDADGSLWLPARRVSLGAMPIPPSWILGHARDAGGSMFPLALSTLPETRAMFDAFLGNRPIVNDAVMRLADGRRVRLVRIIPRDGKLDLTCRTEAR